MIHKEIAAVDLANLANLTNLRVCQVYPGIILKTEVLAHLNQSPEGCEKRSLRLLEEFVEVARRVR